MDIRDLLLILFMFDDQYIVDSKDVVYDLKGSKTDVTLSGYSLTRRGITSSNCPSTAAG